MNLIRRRDPEPGPGPDRRWKVLPVPGPHENPFHGAQILEEIGGPPGLLLWQRVRDVVLWSRFLPRGGGGPFGADTAAVAAPPARAVEPAPAAALEALRRVVTEGERVTGETVAAACSQVREWALDRSCFWTAAYYAEAAAVARPQDPVLAVYAGRVARTQALFPRATQWFKRAVGLARRSERWNAYVIALLGLGTLETMRGRVSQARKYLSAAWKAAAEHRLWSLAAEARHDLLVLEFDAGRFPQAAEHAAAAHRLYADDAPNIPTLAHDWAYLWASQGRHALAFRVLESALPFISQPSARLLALFQRRVDGGDGR